MFRHALVLAAGAAILVDGAAALAGVADDARVTQGTALLKRYPASPWKPLATGSRVPPLSQIKCEDGCTIAADRNNLLVLKPGAVISVEDWFFVPLIPDGQKLSAAHRVVLHEGSIEAVSASEHGLPLVVTVGANEHVALRGARVQIARGEGHTAIGVSEGQARAGASRSWITLEARQTTVLLPNDRPKNPEAMVQSPHWLSENVPCAIAPLAVSDQGKESVVGGCWDAVPHGTQYRVELARDADFRQLLGPAEVTRAPSWSRSLGPGQYFVRVRSVDADGLSSHPSTTRKIAVVPLALPPGSVADATHGAVVLPEGREIAFPERNGLEVAVDNGGFFKAPSSMRMDGAPSHQLRIRLSDDPSSVGTVLVLRRALRADVRITPATPRWPSDPIEIAVTIADPTGQADTSKVEPQIHVLLGLTEVPLSWTHRDAIWSARVEPRRMGGPVVLRVIANDEHGTPLGRNFVEIDDTRPHGAAEKPAGWRVAEH